MPDQAKKPRKKKPVLQQYFLTNRMNALNVLSTGLAQPAVGLAKAYEDLSTLTPGRLPIWSGPCPSNLEVVLSGNRQGVFPVAFEIDPRRLSISGAPAIDAKGQAINMSEGGSMSEAGCLLPEMVLPLCAMVGLHFRSDNELADFHSRDFANTDLDALRCVVTPSLFDGAPIDLDQFKSALSSVPAGERISSQLLRGADALAGAVALLLSQTPPSRSWCGAIEGLLKLQPSSPAASRPVDVLRELLVACGWEVAGTSAVSLDLRFLSAALRYLVASRSTNGWVGTSFAEAVTKSTLEGVAISDRGEVDKWTKYALEVARAEREAAPLDDTRSAIRRALVLLMLRPDAERLMNSRNSSLQPGDEVLAIASLMCGAFHGLSMLPKSMKSKAAFKSAWPGVVSEWINDRASVGCSGTKGLKFKPTMAVLHEEAARTRIEWSLGGEILAGRSFQPTDGLMRCYYDCKKLDFVLSYDWESKCLVVLVPCGTENKREVLVFEGRKDHKGRHTIRFEACCAKLGRGGLKREEALDCLRRNGSMALNCRFSLAEDGQSLLVQAEQLLDTMDLEELAYHLEHVAHVASEYKQRGQGLGLFGS